MKFKHFLFALSLMFLMVCTVFVISAFTLSNPSTGEARYIEKEVIVYDTVYVNNSVDNKEIPVRVTVYQAVEEQCDEDPLVTADGTYITDEGYYAWCAVSRNLIFWHLDFGDTLVVENIHGAQIKLIVHDLMHKRKHNQVDILIPPGNYLDLLGSAEAFVHKDSLSKITKVIRHE